MVGFCVEYLHKFYMFYLLKTTAAISLREFWLEILKNVDQRMETRCRFLNLSSFVSGYSEGNKVNSGGKIPGDEMSAISCILDVFLLDVRKTTKNI